MIFADESHALETVDAGQLEVQKDELGLSRSHHFQRLATIANSAQD
jgi:RecA/RadA recombinase